MAVRDPSHQGIDPMNRTEHEIAEVIGLILGLLLRSSFELIVFVILPLVSTTAVGFFWLHDWLTSSLIDVFDLPDSFLLRVLIGTALFPVLVAAIAATLLVAALSLYVVVTASLYVVLKVALILMFCGALLSLLAYLRQRIGGGIDAEFDLDFAHIFDD
jgi:hypothetical protein